MQTLYPYTVSVKQIIHIQQFYRNYLKRKLKSLQGDIVDNFNICVNQEDVQSLDSFLDIPSHLLFSFKETDGTHYGFDIRSIRSILKFDKENPYTRNALTPSVVERANEMLRLLKVLNLSVENEKVEEVNQELEIKRRVVKVFHDMDQLDQYTDPDWFLDMNTSKLIKFYKEAEDVWNYRLNLTSQVKKAIVPPDGIAFQHTVKSVSLIKDKVQLQKICLDFMEKLIHSAELRPDRVNGCIYILLGLVIVSRSAALALPSYYSMVMGDDSLTGDVDIMI
jgi:hypothetical protein